MDKPDQSLADYALERLRRVAEGNGVDPLAITVKNCDEKDVTLTGTLMLTPKVEVEHKRLVGKVSGLPKSEKNFTRFTELAHFIAEQQYAFGQDRKAWFDDVCAELDKQPGLGWGLDDARVMLDQKPPMHATARETCVSCGGRGNDPCLSCSGLGYLPCLQCNQSGVESCYVCYGSGRNPQNQEQPCLTCNGARFVTCRNCQGRKGLPCGHCRASGILICDTCQGGGGIVEHATLHFGADAQFAPGSGAELPAALRRAIDRAGGMKALVNGHATITYSVPKDQEKFKSGSASLEYKAQFRVADLVIDFFGEAKRITVFGHKKTMIEVPAFLDKPLKEGVDHLRSVAAGKGSLTDVGRYRLIREACSLLLEGRLTLEALRRLYPLGVSRGIMEALIRSLRQALDRSTRIVRWVGVTITIVFADVLAGALYFTPIHSMVVSRAGRGVGLLLELAVPLLCAGTGYILTSKLALTKLSRIFPQTPLAHHGQGSVLALVAAALGFIVPFALSLLSGSMPLWRSLF